MAQKVTLETLHEELHEQKATAQREFQAVHKELGAHAEELREQKATAQREFLAVHKELGAHAEELREQKATAQREFQAVHKELRAHSVDIHGIHLSLRKIEDDVAQLQTGFLDLHESQEAARQDLGDMRGMLVEISTTTQALTSAVTQTLADLALSRSYERRITDLEVAVFSKPRR